MGKYIDFQVRFDPETESKEILAKRILYSLIVRRIKGKKPVTIFLGGDSGEGKSWAALRLTEVLLEMQGIDAKEYIDETNVFIPLEYANKLNKLLGLEKSEKDLKKVNIMTVHEAREAIKAKMWYSFINQAISDVNAMSRTIKRMCFIIISQFIRDISSDIRYTLTYYITAERPIGRKTRLKISKMWKDDRNLEQPKLRKRCIRGYIIYPNGRKRFIQPEYIEMSKPSKEVIELFEKRDFESKALLIRKKMEKLIQEMSLDFESDNSRVKLICDWYIKNPSNIKLIGKTYRGKWKVKPEVKAMHNLTDVEMKEFQDMLNKNLKEKGLLESKEDEYNGE